ncbi:unnamed protein product [Schistosoma margrebowiei]|uniref:Uncharacterized protein n=1 Tax=Schistosoma margrebowiei TaxID=48269 RepID=A0A183MIF5_9TREM|nr:unnamed protein product [Schistosoma margrebowiei]
MQRYASLWQVVINFNLLLLDDYSVAQQIKVCLTTALGYNNNNLSRNNETQPCEAEKPKRFVPTYQMSYSSSSKADLSSPPSLSDDINHMFTIILKAVTELSSKMDRLIAVCERLAMGVSERHMKDKDIDAINFPLRTHGELRSLERALENQKFRDHFEKLCGILENAEGGESFDIVTNMVVDRHPNSCLIHTIR